MAGSRKMARWPFVSILPSSVCASKSIVSCLFTSSGRGTKRDLEASAVAGEGDESRSLRLAVAIEVAPARRADASAGVTPIAAAATCRGLNASTFGGVARRRRDASESREGSLDCGASAGGVTVPDSPALSA